MACILCECLWKQSGSCESYWPSGIPKMYGEIKSIVGVVVVDVVAMDSNPKQINIGTIER